MTLQKAQLDFAFIDNEHIAMNRADMSRLCQVFRGYGIDSIVRVPSPDPFLASQAIDAGATGVIMPYVEKISEVRELVGAVKYKPIKGAQLQRIINGEETLSVEMQRYVDQFNAGRICIVNIESVAAMNILDELLSVPGLDGVFIGPHDLSVSLGVPEQYDHPVFEEAVTKIIHTTRDKGLAIGVHLSLEPERQIKWVKEGANIVMHSFDVALFTQRLMHDMNIIREGVGDRVGHDTANDLIV